MDRFIVNQEPDSLLEYKAEIEKQLAVIKTLALALEKTPSEIEKVHTLREVFQELWVASTALDLIPVVENINIVIHAFDFIITHKYYPTSFTAFILLFTDELITIASDVIVLNSIDLFAAQKNHVALQKISLAKTPEELDTGVIQAISNLLKSENKIHFDMASDSEIELFDDFDKLNIDIIEGAANDSIFEIENQDDPIQSLSKDFNLHYTSSNPIIEARAYMVSKAADPYNLLSEMSDKLTCHGKRHTSYLQEISLALNIMLGSPVDPDDLWLGLALHDIGLASMSERLEMPTPLSSSEMHAMKKHPTIGVILAKKMGVTGGALKVIEQHHEQINGKGYPHGLKGDDISLEGKITAIADAFHSMVSKRPHKLNARRNLFHVISEIDDNSGAQFDSQIVEVFIQCLKEFWIPRHIVKTENNNVKIDFEI